MKKFDKTYNKLMNQFDKKVIQEDAISDKSDEIFGEIKIHPTKKKYTVTIANGKKVEVEIGKKYIAGYKDETGYLQKYDISFDENSINVWGYSIGHGDFFRIYFDRDSLTDADYRTKNNHYHINKMKEDNLNREKFAKKFNVLFLVGKNTYDMINNRLYNDYINKLLKVLSGV